MSFFSRLSLGWTIAENSFKVIRTNKQLMLFPIFSGIAVILVVLSFIAGLFAAIGWNVQFVETNDPWMYVVCAFIFYYVTNFIIIFFNVALVHCTHLYFNGEMPTVSAGIRHSLKRIRAILGWSLLAATVGWLLKLIQENSGIVGKIITALVGIVWGIATFFVLPVIAYESTSPFGAVKRSAQLMKEKWGESIGAGFSFGFFKLIAMLLIGFVAFLAAYFIHPFVGIAIAIPCVLALLVVFSTAETVFVSAIYHKVHGDPIEHFNDQLVDSLFVHRKKGLF